MVTEGLKREVLRINQRYLTEVVLALGFCPWADSVRDSAGLQRVVFSGESTTAELGEETARTIEEIAQNASVSIGLLIYPELRISNAGFRRFVSSMESSHALRHTRTGVVLAMASFHPEARANTDSPARLVPFIRRSPDPTIQLVRRETMDSVRQGKNEGSVFVDNLQAFLPMMSARPKPSISDGISKANLRTVNRVGVTEIEKILEDIARDRDSAYAVARKQR